MPMYETRLTTLCTRKKYKVMRKINQCNAKKIYCENTRTCLKCNTRRNKNICIILRVLQESIPVKCTLMSNTNRFPNLKTLYMP